MPSLKQMHTLPPKHVEVLVIGGGPAGSYAASVLAREGVDVAIFEASKFPRYHIGESLIPSIRHYLRFIDAEEKLANHGFLCKPGSAIKFNQFKREGYTDFVALGHNNNAWNVVRSEFDQLLMDHARSSGAAVYELTKVVSLEFSNEDSSQPISASWTHMAPMPPSPPSSPHARNSQNQSDYHIKTSKPAAIKGITTFTYLIDATGREGLLSTKYLKNRHINASLKNIAVWGYWKHARTYGVGTKREGAPWFEALTDESGWAWFIPLHNGTTSVGVVMNQELYNKKVHVPHCSPFSPEVTPNFTGSAMVSRYLFNLGLAPGLVQLLDGATMADRSVRSASDFSYSAPRYAGPGFRIVGDAGAFIDPFFSSGIHLALTSALSAASTICASFREDCSENEAADWHTKRVATSYTRFQVVVLSAYKQIRAQNVNVLSDIDEDNYDRAFAYLRPVIQGAADMGARLSETELQKSLDFCLQLFNPTSPEQHDRALKRGGEAGKELLDVTRPVMDPAVFAEILKHTTLHSPKQPTVGDESDSDEDMRMVLTKINARRVVHAEYTINNLESEPLNGFVVRLERGRLGLVRPT